MGNVKRIIFVCMDNTCRSIMAEAVMRSACEDEGIEIASRGLIVLFPEPLNPKAVAVLRGNQMVAGKEFSEALTEEDIQEGTLILTMTEREAEMVRDRFPNAEQVEALGHFAGKPGDIEEPYGGSLAEYGAFCEYMDLLVKLAAEILFRPAEEKEIQAARMRDGEFY